VNSPHHVDAADIRITLLPLNTFTLSTAIYACRSKTPRKTINWVPKAKRTAAVMIVQTSHPSKACLRTIPLDKNWCFKQSSCITPIAQTYTPVAQFPTVVHLDLLKNDLIPDPYVGTNELDCLWINDADWTYKTAFTPPEVHDEDNVWMVFEGLDTAVDVYLDGEHLFFSKDMFIPRRVDVTRICGRKRKEMQLVLRFRSPTRFAKEEEQRVGFKKAPTDNTIIGGHARMYLPSLHISQFGHSVD